MKFSIKQTIPAVMAGLMLAVPNTAFAASLTLNLNGVAGDVYTKEADGDVVIPDVTASFGDEYKLKGWNTARNGSGESYKTGDKVSKDTVLYAQWESGFMKLVTDSTDLDTAINAAKAITQGKKSDEQFQALQDAINAAVKVLNTDNAEQSDLDAALEKLKAAVTTFNDALGDKSALKALIKEAEAIEQGKKSSESFSTLKSAIKTAQAVADNASAEQLDCNDAVTALRKAIAVFNETLGDKTILNDTIKEAKAIEQGKKSDEQFQALQDAIAAAEKVANYEAAEQSDCDAAVEALVAAVKTFDEAIGSKIELTNAIAEAKEITQGNKTDEAWKALQDAITKAESVLHTDGDLEAKDINDAVAALESAVKTFNDSADKSSSSSSSKDSSSKSSSKSGSSSDTETPKDKATLKTSIDSTAAIAAGTMVAAAAGTGAYMVKRNKNKSDDTN